MQKDLDSYVKVYKQFIPKIVCETTVTELETNCDWSNHAYYSPKTDAFTSYDKEFSLCYNENIITHNSLMQKTWDAINEYVTNDLKFDWFNGWNGFSSPRYNRYTKNTLMKEHCDHIHSMFQGSPKGIPILTVLGCLNEDYVGGDLIMFQDKTIEMKTGDIVIFPSNFLYPHKVTEITEGTRYTFVSWVT